MTNTISHVRFNRILNEENRYYNIDSGYKCDDIGNFSAFSEDFLKAGNRGNQQNPRCVSCNFYKGLMYGMHLNAYLGNIGICDAKKFLVDL